MYEDIPEIGQRDEFGEPLEHEMTEPASPVEENSYPGY